MLGLFLTCFVALVASTVLLLGFGQRARLASRVVGFGLVVTTAALARLTVHELWSVSSSAVEAGVIVVVACGAGVVLVRGAWNPIGQAFFATFLAAAGSYLAFGVDTTIRAGLSPEARLASGVLLIFELAALALAASFTFESCDAVCRVRRSRPAPRWDRGYLPMVSIQLAAYNEPPDMLIETIKSLERLDYPKYEIVVIDNNTKDPEVWQPVARYCRGRRNISFVHVDPWPGFKAGALNLALTEHTHPDADIIGIVDSDYLVNPAWLRDLVGYFVDPAVAFVQPPQDYRAYGHDAYLRACYDAYQYFFSTTMPSRHERNSIIFAGTMGLVRRSTLEKVGGWDQWCITEDAELSLRMLRAGYEGVYVPRSYGRGIMPLTFTALKSQRFRWCFGGMQILRLHWRDLLPWRRDPENHLSVPQRIDYLLGSVQWMNDLIYLAFTIVLLASGVVLLEKGPVGLRPLYGAAVLLPSALIVSGVVRALWALRVRTGIGWKRATLAFVSWLSLSWTVAVACVQGLTRDKGTFLRTPKVDERNRLLAALWSARAETGWWLALWGTAVLVTLDGRATPFVLALLGWQGLVYASAPYLSWLNQHTELSAQLERRRRTERLRERAATLAPVSVGALGAAAAAAAIAVIIGVGGANPGQPANPFAPTAQHPSSPRVPAAPPGGTNSGANGGTSTPGTSPTTPPTSTPSTTNGTTPTTTRTPPST